MATIRIPTPRGLRWRPLSSLFAIVWSVVLIVGISALVRYQGQTGIAASPPASWPDDTALARERDCPTLLVFAHPECPCTRATVGELDRIVARCGEKLRVAVVMLSLPELDDARDHGALREAIERIPGVEILPDRDGAIARRFGVATSGQTLLYAPDGRLVFQGGITAARGHSGDNAGAASIVANVLGRSPGSASAPVYGCCLFRSRDDSLPARP
ncbi:MAG TPA: hypothetical protein VM509_04225 [Planctomycetota bacterium]|nr:hypothetical protein [Planctomycetota bacterium]